MLSFLARFGGSVGARFWTVAALFCGCVAPAAASPILLSEKWESSDAGFAACAARVEAYRGRNLLARREARVANDSAQPVGDPAALVDGEIGTRGAHGRVFINGQPTVIAWYLGGPRTIKEVGVFSFNGDMRANQDYEVRFANNAKKPGQRPAFPAKPDLTTGDQVLGQDRGGFHTRFVDEKGQALLKDKVDWVEFRIWRTYPVKAGHAAHSTDATSGASLVEIEVLGEEHDVVLPSPEQLAHRKALRETPNQPEYVKRDTWRETLSASREAMRQWEDVQDRLAMFDNARIAAGPWHVLGPIPARSKLFGELSQKGRVDLSAKYEGQPGESLAWRPLKELRDGEIHDLAPQAPAKDQVLLFCRDVTLNQPVGRNELGIEIAGDGGRAIWLPSRTGLGVRSLAQVFGDTEVRFQENGPCQVLVELRAGQQGQRRFYFALKPNSHRPGAGNVMTRASRRQQLAERVRTDFPSAPGQLEMTWELSGGLWVPPHPRAVDDWLPGHQEIWLRAHYASALQLRLRRLDTALAETSGIRAETISARRQALVDHVAAVRKAAGSLSTFTEIRDQYYQLCSLEETIALAGRLRSIRLAVQDHQTMFGDRYPAAASVARLGRFDAAVAAVWSASLARPASRDSVLALAALSQEIETAQQEILLATPLLAFEKLLAVKGRPSFAANWTGPNRLGDEIIALSPVRPDGTQSTVHRGTVSDMDLHWDGRRLLFCDAKAIFEINVDGSGLRRVSAEDPPITHYDACYLPNGQIVCASNACEQAVPCTGGADVGNLHVLDADGRNERRLTYDQDHDWNPAVMNDGRVLYTRWEYTDLPHYFSRMLFRMNPDGTGQMEYYGSNSYWPNAMYWPRPIPGHPTAVVCIVSGHHGVSRVGELLLLDPARGRFEADGATQRIPGYGQKVEPIIRDNLVGDSWPKFAAPYPLAEPGTNAGAGKYFLVCVQRDAFSQWDLCLVDVFDNITPILRGGYMTPIPVRARPVPPVIPSTVDPDRREGTIYLADIYQGKGLAGYPRGSIKALRVGTHHYRYAGNGDTRASSLEGGWDIKRILGVVPVHEDGSALFRVPANTPIFVQPLDAEGKAQQQMRSWYTAMPGETASCIGCHERQNSGPPGKATLAARQRPATIQPWNGPVRGFSFDREVQPVLDRYCVGCHDGQPQAVPGAGNESPKLATPDFRAKRLHKDFSGDYSPAYLELQRYVRRPGYESDNHMHVPAEFEADTSVLVQMLKKGHYGVELSTDAWQRLYAWIDYNVPYPANWRESHRPPRDEQVERRAKYKKLYAGIDDHDEDSLPLPEIAQYQPPRPVAKQPEAPQLAGWPLTAQQAAEAQRRSGPKDLELDLGDGVTMKFVVVPSGRFVMGTSRGFPDEGPAAPVAIERPFYLGCLEVTNRQYAQFDAKHDSGYAEGRWKDRTTRGYPINGPDQPVVRISWNEAMAFCEWLSQKTGRRCTLPTEAQWEWACRAGSGATYHFGEYTAGQNQLANIADAGIATWNYGRCEPGYSDGVPYSGPGGKFAANAWGLCDMHGNVAEWTLSSYRPYPYQAHDGRNDPRSAQPRVVRGGSWNDTFRYATSASRWRYPAHQPVYNVGFRVLVDLTPASVAQR